MTQAETSRPNNIANSAPAVVARQNGIDGFRAINPAMQPTIAPIAQANIWPTTPVKLAITPQIKAKNIPTPTAAIHAPTDRPVVGSDVFAGSPADGS